MTNSADDSLLSALDALRRAMVESAVPAMVIGGIAVIARGVPRQTVDIDALFWGPALDLERLLDVLDRNGFAPRVEGAADFARQRHVLLLRHALTGVPLDLTLGYLPFEREALARAEEVDFGGVRLAVASAEDLIIMKAVAWRDRDRGDIERLCTLHGSRIDAARVIDVVTQFAEALDEPQRAAQLRELLARPRRGS